jgi:hypothetical protein
MKKISKKLEKKINILADLIFSDGLAEDAPTDIKSFSIWESPELGVEKINRALINVEINRPLKERLEKLLKQTTSHTSKPSFAASAGLKRQLKYFASRLSEEIELHERCKKQVEHLTAANKSLLKEIEALQGISNTSNNNKSS